MNKNDRTTVTIVAISLLPTVLPLIDYMRIRRIERKKRQAIEHWKHENLACIENSRDRILNMINEGATMEEVWAAIDEERQFLNIVRDQPMY